MEAIFKGLATFFFIIIVTMALQVLAQGVCNIDAYPFEQYTIMGWIAQVVYWGMSLFLAAWAGYDVYEWN